MKGLKKSFLFLSVLLAFSVFFNSCQNGLSDSSDGGGGSGYSNDPDSSQDEKIEHNITFELNGGEWAEGYEPATKFYENESFILPDSTKVINNDYIFLGWYDSGNEKITEISKNTKCDKTFYEPRY